MAGLAGCSLFRDEPEEPEPEPTEPTPETPTVDSDPPHDVRDFGAAVDGETDDTEAVRSAIAHAGPGETVFFPSGTTLVSSLDSEDTAAVRLHGDDLPENLTLAGTGKDAVLRMDGGHSGHHQLFFIEVAGGIEGLEIRDLRLDGNRDEQPGEPGSGGHAIISDSADSDDVPVSVLIENVWVERWNQSGITPHHGGFVVNQCTVRECSKHGISPDSWYDVHKYEPPIEVRNCYCYRNGTDSRAPTYGIDVSGGKVLVEDCVCEGNAQGTKTTPDVIEATYRRVRLTDNEINGYLRPGSEGNTDERGVVRFEDVVSEGNGSRGFRLGAYTDYVVPEGSAIVARANARQGDNILVTQDAAFDASTVWSTCAQSGYGLNSPTRGSSRVGTYYHFDNAAGPLGDLNNTKIEKIIDVAEMPERLATATDPGCPGVIEGVPTAADVGAVHPPPE
ncbi:glycoside hydrolase family 55 protein [Natronomonas marina]|uniref:glycoside hydrolase family 55 protein n=1 Tax=Natronomonas marina TaxID=2961939 RepID=UPI0020C9F0AB|nr:glycoside hydrolase family 55 protein [Natronomonas marina]